MKMNVSFADKKERGSFVLMHDNSFKQTSEHKI